MKKVIIAINSSWYAYFMRYNLAKALKNNGYEVLFLAPFDEKYSEILKQDFKFIHIDIDSAGINPFKDIATLFSFYKIYKSQKPDVVLNFTIKPNIYSAFIAGMLGIKSINNITGLGTIFIKQNILTKIVKMFYKVSLNLSTKVFFQNKDDKKLFIENNMVKEIKTDLVPGSGVDLERFRSIEKEKNTKFTFLLIARLLKDKGVLEYIEAIKILKENYKDVEFQILGEVGSNNKTSIDKKELDLWVENGLVNYLGVSDNVEDIIAQSDCVVLPSYREGTPRSLLEAAAMSKPLIATNVVGCKEVVDDKVNGYLCEVKNANDLSEKMIMMIELSDKQREAMGKAGRYKMLKEFDEKIVIDKYLQTINEMLK